MYFDVPSVKTKFIVQPLGETMQVPAATALTETPSVPAYGGAVPRQFGWIVVPLANETSTPLVPAATIFASSSLVSHAGRGCGSVLSVPSALAPAAATSTNAHTAAETSRSFFIQRPPRWINQGESLPFQLKPNPGNRRPARPARPAARGRGPYPR